MPLKIFDRPAKMADSLNVELSFTKLLDGLTGSEGPVFDKEGNFFMVAPTVIKDGEFAGQILRIDLDSKKVILDTFDDHSHAPF